MFRHSIIYFLYRKLKYSYLNDNAPLVASMKVTQRCNLHCTHCTWVNKIKDDLPLDKWKEIIDITYERGCYIVFVEGGEPTLRDDLVEIIQYIKKKGMLCVLFSNATRGLPDCDLDAIWISIDGVESSHDQVRGNGAYQKVLKTLEKNPDVNSFSMTTLSKVNAADIEAICKELSATSLKGLIFNFMYPYNGTADKNYLSTEERIKCAQQILELKQKYPKIVSSDAYLKAVGKPDKSCYPWLLLLATADGKISHGCTVEPAETRNCDVCDMMCGLEASLGFELNRDSVNFWKLINIKMPIDINLVPDWVLRIFNKNINPNT